MITPRDPAPGRAMRLLRLLVALAAVGRAAGQVHDWMKEAIDLQVGPQGRPASVFYLCKQLQ